MPSASIISTRYASATATNAVWLTSTTTSPKKPASTVSVVLASGEPAAGEPSVKPSTWKSLSLTGAFTMAVCAPSSMSLLSVWATTGGKSLPDMLMVSAAISEVSPSDKV